MEGPAAPRGAGAPQAAQDAARVQPRQPLPWDHCPGGMAHRSTACRAGAGDLRGSAPAGRFSSCPRRVSLLGGGRLLWHDLLALPLSAWGRNQVPCSTTAVLSWQDQAQPRSCNADSNNLPGAQASTAMLTLPRKGRPAHQQRGKPCSCRVRDRIRPSAPDMRSPDPACPQHRGLGLETALPPHPPSLSCTPFSWKGAFPTQTVGRAVSAQHRQDLLGRQLYRRQSRQRHWAGQCQACVGRCKVLCNGGSNYVQDSLDVHQNATPLRGMAAAQPLTATRHDSLGQDVDESAVRAVSAVQGRGQSGPVLNPGMARGYHAPGADVQQDSSELVVNWRLSRCGLCGLRVAVSLGGWVRGVGLIRPLAGAVVLPRQLEEVRQD